MLLPQIRLESTFARIGIESPRGQQSIEQPRADIDIQQPQAEMTIDRTPSKLSIDQTQAWEEMDLKHIFRRIEEFADLGYQDHLTGIARRAQEGDALMRIENGGNPIPEIARRNTEKIYDYKLGFVPSPFSVKIDYQPAKVDIQWKVNKPIINSKARKAITEYKPSPVEISMKQDASLKIDFAHLKYKGYRHEQQI